MQVEEDDKTKNGIQEHGDLLDDVEFELLHPKMSKQLLFVYINPSNKLRQYFLWPFKRNVALRAINYRSTLELGTYPYLLVRLQNLIEWSQLLWTFNSFNDTFRVIQSEFWYEAYMLENLTENVTGIVAWRSQVWKNSNANSSTLEHLTANWTWRSLHMLKKSSHLEEVSTCLWRLLFPDCTSSPVHQLLGTRDVSSLTSRNNGLFH